MGQALPAVLPENQWATVCVCSTDIVSRIIYLHHIFHASLSGGLAFPYLSQQLVFNKKPGKLKILL